MYSTPTSTTATTLRRPRTLRHPDSPPTDVHHLNVVVDFRHLHRSILFLDHVQAGNHSLKMHISTSDEAASAIWNRRIEEMIAPRTPRWFALLRRGMHGAWPSALPTLLCGALAQVLSCLFKTNRTDKDSLSCDWRLCFCFHFCVYVYACWKCRRTS